MPYHGPMSRGQRRQPARGGLHLTKEQIALLAFVGAIFAGVSAATDVFGFLKDDPPSAVSTASSANVRETGKNKEEPPFTVAVTQPIDFCVGWISNNPNAVRPEIRMGQINWPQWANYLKATPLSGNPFYFTIQGVSEAEVTLHAMRIRLAAPKRPPLAGRLIHQACGGPAPYRTAVVHLDKTPPSWKALIDDGLTPPDRFQARPLKFPYKVSISDAETFWVLPLTEKCHCLWRIELDWASQGKSGTYIVDNSGHPFETTSETARTMECVFWGGEIQRYECPRRS